MSDDRFSEENLQKIVNNLVFYAEDVRGLAAEILRLRKLLPEVADASEESFNVILDHFECSRVDCITRLRYILPQTELLTLKSYVDFVLAGGKKCLAMGVRKHTAQQWLSDMSKFGIHLRLEAYKGE